MVKVFCIVGPTGVGKTEIAIELAKKYDLDIISADARQIYKYMDIGTAKPSSLGFKFQVSSFTIHMIDIIIPDILYSAADFARDCEKVIKELVLKKRNFILVGGSGLYLKALFEPFFSAPPRDLKLRKRLESEPIEKLYERLKLVDRASAERIKPQDRQRIIRALEIYEQTHKPMSEQIIKKSQEMKYNTEPTEKNTEQHRKNPELNSGSVSFGDPQCLIPSEFIPYYVGLTMDRKKLYEKINNRFDDMIEKGLVDEVKNLLRLGYSEKDNALNGIGYYEIIRFLNQEISLMEAIYLAKNRSRQYAKRQMTWFKKVEGIKWIEFTNLDETVQKVSQQYEKYLQSI